MKMQERLAALIQNNNEALEDINHKIDVSIRDTERLRTRRLEIEEESVEARVTLNLLQFHHLNVERNEEGVIVASVDPLDAPRGGAG